MLKKKTRIMIYLMLIIIAMLGFAAVSYMNLPKFGRLSRGERLKRIEQSPNYHEGRFHNQEFTPQLSSDKSRVRVMFDFLFEKRVRNRPKAPLPVVRTNLTNFDKQNEVLVWLGHSSSFIQSGGKRILVDPVFADASPVSFVNKPFVGTNIYKADDMPDIDYLIITHDHWDHLDYETVVALQHRVQKVICPLGVGEHFEHWGYRADQLIEMDWNEHYCADGIFTIYCLPARHFSGRTFRSNQTLWASYMVVTPSQTIYLSGDSGYGSHYREIAVRFPHIDLAVMENGQYNQDWRYIHLMPEDLKKAIKELNPKKVLAVHNSKYSLSKHPWDEPLRYAASIPLVIMPKIGEIVQLQDSATVINHSWWNNID